MLNPYNWTGQNMRKLRVEYLRLSQEDMADLIGVERCTLSKWETGKVSPIRGRQITHAIHGIRRLDELARRNNFKEVA